MSYALNKTKYLLEPEVLALGDTFTRYATSDTRDMLALELALRTGARANELLAIKVSDLNPHDKSVFIKGIKNSNDREIPITDSLYARLSVYAQGKKGELFDIGYHRLRDVWEHYRPVEKKFHSLRHTFAINLYKKTRDLKLVQVALGHKNIQNTMIYADYVYSQEELRKLVL